VQHGSKRADHFLYVGRLSEEKGVHLLLEAFQKTNYKLKLAGDGPLKQTILNNCLVNTNMEYMGILENDKVREVMQHCIALIFPSIWYEVMPLTIIEAFSVGTPVIAAKIGAMEELIINDMNGSHFENGNIGDLLNQLEYFNNLKNDEYEQMSKNTLLNFENKFSSGKNIVELESIYYRIASDNRDLKYNSAYEF
jgi:glycosyltransferase involved in cell wall biosynthesis